MKLLALAALTFLSLSSAASAFSITMTVEEGMKYVPKEYSDEFITRLAKDMKKSKKEIEAAVALSSKCQIQIISEVGDQEGTAFADISATCPTHTISIETWVTVVDDHKMSKNAKMVHGALCEPAYIMEFVESMSFAEVTCKNGDVVTSQTSTISVVELAKK